MKFDTGKDAPEYEAFEAALQIAERETTAAMWRVSQTYQWERSLGLDDGSESSDDDAGSSQALQAIAIEK
jgi:hypothetical protein